MSYTSSAARKHVSSTNWIAYTFIPTLIHSCILVVSTITVFWCFCSCLPPLLIFRCCNLFDHVHLFCFFFVVSNVPVRQFVPYGPSTDGTSINRKGSAFIYNYQAVTSESETKVRVFSPFSQPPSVDSTAVDSLVDLVSKIHKQITCWFFVQTVASDEPCPIANYTSQDRADGLEKFIE